MNSKRIFIFAVLAFLFLVQQALAEPNSTIQKLMGQPVNLFSYGVDRLRDTMRDAAKNGEFSGGTNLKLGASAYVAIGDSQITINISGGLDPKVAPADFEKLCAIVIQNVRRKAQIDDETGKLNPVLPFSDFAREFFATRSGIPKEDLQELDAIMSIEVVLFRIEFADGIRCTAPLLGTGYAVEK
jgi:hypothetical protein